MFKRLSIFAVIFSGVLLTGCAQQSASTQSATSSDTTTKSSSTKKAPAKTTKSAPTDTKSASDTNSSSDESKTTNSQNSSNNSQTNSDTNSNDTNNSNTTNNNQTSQNQSQQQSQVSLTTADQAVQYLATQLGSTYDKTTTQYVANGKATWDNVTGYQINIYSKNSDSPVGSYLVPENGQYFQIW